MLTVLGTVLSSTFSSEAAVGEIRVRTRVRNSEGRLACALFNSEKNWLKKPVRARRVSLQGRDVTCVFTSVPTGTYALSFFHDENDNGELDTNFIGIPTEGYGASRNAPARFGPPDYEDARFEHKGGVTRMSATTHYW